MGTYPRMQGKALSRRLDRDGARLERYTKRQKIIPVGEAVAVQNQMGRFPNKWDKTGIVMENMDHDKVLVRLDGSRRLTTRNRRFVKKIVSPPDVIVVEPVPTVGQNSPSDSTLGNVVDKSLAVELDTVDPETPDTGYEAPIVTKQDIKTEREASPGDVQHENEQVVTLPLSPVRSDDDNELSVGRPKRTRRPNVKYARDEYDLSLVSVSCPKKLVLSEIVMSKQTKSKGWR